MERGRREKALERDVEKDHANQISRIDNMRPVREISKELVGESAKCQCLYDLFRSATSIDGMGHYPDFNIMETSDMMNASRERAFSLYIEYAEAARAAVTEKEAGMKKLVVNVMRSRNIVFGYVLEIDKSLRDYGMIASGGKIVTEIQSINSPALDYDILFVRGLHSDLDDKPFAYTYNTEEDAKQVVRDINMMVARVNRDCDNAMDGFEKELATLINKHSIENRCDVPDFLLAEMIVNFIQAIGEPIKKTLDWHGCDSVCHPNPKEDELAGGE